MSKYVFMNDRFVEEENAVLHFRDLSFQRGYGIFDFFRLLGSRPLFLEDHFDRFFCSAAQMHLPVPLKREELRQAIFDLIEKNNLPDTGLRLSLTGGYSDDGFSIGKPNLLVSQHSFLPPLEEQVNRGIRLLTYPYQRPLPQVKSIDYQMAIWLQPTRIQQKADDILYHHNGFISECPRSNLFLFTEKETLVTPAGNVLPGITRKKLLELAKKDFNVEERPVGLDELQRAKEVFITSTTKQILPVAQIDNLHFSPGELTRQLLSAFRSTYLEAKLG